MLTPWGIHFLVTQIVGQAVLFYYTGIVNGGKENYVRATVWMTGVINLIVLLICWKMYRRDETIRRYCGVIPKDEPGRFHLGHWIWFLVMGAAFSQFGNMLMSVMQNFLPRTTYYESMEQITQGKSMLLLILCLGIIGPVAEEYVFRGLVYLRLRDFVSRNLAIVISSAIFGLYHMNLLQAIYAWVMGMSFAWLLDVTGSMKTCVLLHVGANLWSLFSPELIQWMLDHEMYYFVPSLIVVLLFVMTGGISYFLRTGGEEKIRRI